MSTDPQIEKSDDQQEPSDGKRANVDRENAAGDEDQPQPAFQQVADEIGRRFREALDQLA